MKKIIICSLSLVLILCSRVVALSNQDFEKRLKEIESMQSITGKLVIDDKMMNEIEKYLIEIKSTYNSDLKQMRLAVYTANIFRKYLKIEFGVESANYQDRLQGMTRRGAYKSALDVEYRYSYRPYFKCADGDKEKMKDLFNRTRSIRLALTGPIDTNIKKVHSPSADQQNDMIRISEQILEICKYDLGAISFLLSEYRIKGDRTKFNNLMLRIIKEDDVDFDYFLAPPDKINAAMMKDYLMFYTHINTSQKELELSKNDVKMVADSVLTKHQKLFDFTDPFYLLPNGFPEPYRMHDALQALISLSNWLRHFQLDELDGKLLDTFFRKDEVLEYLDQFGWGSVEFARFEDYVKEKNENRKSTK